MLETCFSVLLLTLVLTSCSVAPKNSKYSFADGRYVSKYGSDRRMDVYVDNDEDDIYVYRLKKSNNGYSIDTSSQKPVVFSKGKPENLGKRAAFSLPSFDIDFLTMPFKYRFPAGMVPRQFNTNLTELFILATGGTYMFCIILKLFCANQSVPQPTLVFLSAYLTALVAQL
jgi:hypothetical protein